MNIFDFFMLADIRDELRKLTGWKPPTPKQKVIKAFATLIAIVVEVIVIYILGYLSSITVFKLPSNDFTFIIAVLTLLLIAYISIRISLYVGNYIIFKLDKEQNKNYL